MKLLIVADEESAALWDYYRPGVLAPYGLMLSCGDLNAKYLEFMVTMARCPLLYVRGNHDHSYAQNPPEGCDVIEDTLMVYKGLRILGLGGCRRYSGGSNQYTEKQMRKRIRKLQQAIKMVGGVDIVLAHSAPKGVGDWDDHSHQGFASFLELIDRWHPAYLLHGHVHMNYGMNIPRVREYGGTKVINCCGRYELDIEPEYKMPEQTFWQRLYSKMFLKNLKIVF